MVGVVGGWSVLDFWCAFFFRGFVTFWVCGFVFIGLGFLGEYGVYDATGHAGPWRRNLKGI